MEKNDQLINIHPSADVQSEKIGEGTYIWQNTVVLKGATIGARCNINCLCFVENDVIIGDDVTLKSGVYLWDGIHVANEVFIGPNATFVNNPYPRSKQYPDKHIGVTINKGASIGANATIMGGITIGTNSMIGAGSVLTKSTPPFSLWVGNPARHVGYVNKEGGVLTLDLIEKNTGKQFNWINDELVEK